MAKAKGCKTRSINIPDAEYAILVKRNEKSSIPISKIINEDTAKGNRLFLAVERDLKESQQ